MGHVASSRPWLHRALPAFPIDKTSQRPDWLHEIKHDGFRTEVAMGGGRARAFTRRGHDWSDRYARIVEAATALPCRSALIDGEAIVQEADGRP